jgi:hypothetical protein
LPVQKNSMAEAAFRETGSEHSDEDDVPSCPV